MSSQSGETKKKLRGEGGGADVPASKRQKTRESALPEGSLLLETQADILRKVYSFLALKEGLMLRQVHRQFNEARNDIFPYSFVMNKDALKRQGFADNNVIKEYMASQTQALCNLSDTENLRAVLRNETLSSDLVRDFIFNLIKHSKTDNGQAVSILLEDGRCKVCVSSLEECLRKGLTAMAAVLQRDDRVKNDITMCRTCSDNIGCYDCANGTECHIYDEENYAKFCRECVLEDDRFCKRCNYYFCPVCHEDGVFTPCVNCDGLVCISCEGSFLVQCHICERLKCVSCAEEDGEYWGLRGNFDFTVCLTCREANGLD